MVKSSILGDWKPYYKIPDDCFLCPHHYVSGFFGALFVLMVVWDNRRMKEPIISGAGLFVSWFGWQFMWSGGYYPSWGSIFCAVGLVIATIPVLIGLVDNLISEIINRKEDGEYGVILWDNYNVGWGLLYLIFVFIMWDDVIEHMTGIPTPLHTLWETWLKHQM